MKTTWNVNTRIGPRPRPEVQVKAELLGVDAASKPRVRVVLDLPPPAAPEREPQRPSAQTLDEAYALMSAPQDEPLPLASAADVARYRAAVQHDPIAELAASTDELTRFAGEVQEWSRRRRGGPRMVSRYYL